MSEDDLQERTLLRHWVLLLVSCYYTVLASDYVTIEEALSGPVVSTDWRDQKDVNSVLQKYGLLFQIYDRIASLGFDYTVPLLVPHNSGNWGGLFLGCAMHWSSLSMGFLQWNLSS